MNSLTKLLLGGAMVGMLGTQAPAEDKKPPKPENRVFEMRTYYAAPGKMEALHARFRDHTCKLFEKHGITLIGFWSPITPKEAEQKMVYILAFSSKEPPRSHGRRLSMTRIGKKPSPSRRKTASWSLRSSRFI